MLGSVPRTASVNTDLPLSHRLHINGNALYNTHSASFHRFLFECKQGQHMGDRATFQKSPHGNAYDVDLATCLYVTHLLNVCFFLFLCRVNRKESRRGSKHRVALCACVL
eukprot:m.88048 g.88048  ORF g.88048 m.88048 type:complete len:110 (-) comp12849_c0_seq2:643-972(-)